MKKIIPIDSYQPSPTDRFLFDNNILMYIFCPLGNYHPAVVRSYSLFLKQILKSGSSLFTTSLIISEFFNSCIRLEYNQLRGSAPKRYQEFKRDYRSTDKFLHDAEIYKDIILRKILAVMKKIDDHFMQIDSELLLRGVDNSFDFNDRILQAIATVDDLIIVTNDSDFSTGPFDTRIITGNKRLLGYYIKP